MRYILKSPIFMLKQKGNNMDKIKLLLKIIEWMDHTYPGYQKLDVFIEKHKIQVNYQLNGLQSIDLKVEGDHIGIY